MRIEGATGVDALQDLADPTPAAAVHPTIAREWDSPPVTRSVPAPPQGHAAPTRSDLQEAKLEAALAADVYSDTPHPAVSGPPQRKREAGSGWIAGARRDKLTHANSGDRAVSARGPTYGAQGLMSMRGRGGLGQLLGPLLLLLGACGGGGGNGTTTATPPAAKSYTVALGDEATVLDTATRNADGWAFGPPDGTIGALAQASGQYAFFMPANSSAACTGTPSVQGTYRMGGALTNFTPAYGCSAVLRKASQGQPDPNGWTFDQDYAGGGPVLTLTSGGRSGLLHIYHGEFHSGTCKNGNPCFYAALGAAFSTDGGATFRKMGEIAQPYVTRAYVFSVPQNLDVGGGTLLLADINGRFVTNASSADPSSLYLYVFYTDLDTTLTTSPCVKNACLALARAKLSDVIAAAFAGDTAAFPTLFKKFYNGAFTEPATSKEPSASVNSGHYTPIVMDVGAFPSVIYDTVTQNYVMAYEQNNDSVVMRHGEYLLNWSAADASGSFSNAPNGEVYTTLIGESGDPTVSNGNPYVFYVKSTAPWPDWPASSLVMRSVHLSLK